jgi:GNAT superfamily N-acetyltransferase
VTAELRLLSPGDAAALDAFLRRHTDSSMFLRSNARAAGLEYQGKPLQATYVAAFAGDAITSVAAHCWNGMILVQAPEQVGEVTRAVARHSRRPVAGFSGPAGQVGAARHALGLDDAPAAKDSAEGLYALALRDLVVSPALASGAVVCRHPHANELDLLTQWRVAFSIEALGFSDRAILEPAAREDILRHQANHSQWILLDGGRPVSYSAFNARLPDAVQIGGVWTPPEARGRGYARAVVAGSLLEAREQGATRAVLFADDPAARRAYEAIGFRAVGAYGLVLLREPMMVAG